jgi:hypothetical protein
MSIQFHAVFLDETGCEFGATIRANTKDEAWEIAREDYPESRCVQMESPEDTAAREARIYRAARFSVDDYYPEDEEDDEDDDDEDDLDDEDDFSDFDDDFRNERNQRRAEAAEY